MRTLPEKLRADYSRLHHPRSRSGLSPVREKENFAKRSERDAGNKGRCVVPHHVNLNPTHDLHRQLNSAAQQDSSAYREICLQAQNTLAEHGTKFEGDTAMGFALSALCLDRASILGLQEIAESLHEIVESALAWAVAGDDRIREFFTDHQRMLPWLTQSPGMTSWQGVSRYDAVITRDGSVRILELNTGCPAGFMHAEDFSNVTLDAIGNLKQQGTDVSHGLGLEGREFGTIPGSALVDELLAIEEQSGLGKGLIALINDENELKNELELIAQAFRKRGREAEIVNACDIEYTGGRAVWRNTPLSLCYNKIRISTAGSPKHHWRPGFESRYGGYLHAIQDGAVVAVNNLAALSIAEDKGLLELLRVPEFQDTLRPEQCRFVNEYVLWTARLSDRRVFRHDEELDLLPYVRAHREQFVIKPANEGRGFGVVVGKYATQSEWEAACEIDPALPCVVQDYAEPARLPIVRVDDTGAPSVLEHHLTVGLAVIRGQARGVLSRISANPVTNVGREGIVQAVFLTD